MSKHRTSHNFILSEFKKEIEKYMLGREYFCCVYGSYGSGTRTPSSDLDLFVALPRVSEKDRKALIILTKRFHKRNGLKLDAEVPYENKVVVSYMDIQNVIDLKPFRKRNGDIVVAPVRKTKLFLSSRSIRQRLLLNALTTPHVFLAGNHTVYVNYRRKAERAVHALGKALCPKNAHTLQGITQALLSGPRGEDGELYLGYKGDVLEVVEYLRRVIKKASLKNPE